jgi:hypothetical protein
MSLNLETIIDDKILRIKSNQITALNSEEFYNTVNIFLNNEEIGWLQSFNIGNTNYTDKFKDSKIASFYFIYFEKRFRGKGYGLKTFESLIDYSRSKNCDVFIVENVKSSKFADFFKVLGFEKADYFITKNSNGKKQTNMSVLL